MGSGDEPHRERADPLGKWLAGIGVHLLTGGGGGVMAALSRAYFETPGRSGHIIGILPGLVRDGGYTPPHGYPNAWVEIPIHTHLGRGDVDDPDSLSRNPINILSSDLIIALPGASGTLHEIQLARRYAKPLIAWLDDAAQIPGLPERTRVEAHFETIKGWAQETLQGLGFVNGCATRRHP